MEDDDEEDGAGVFASSTSDDPRYAAVFEDDGQVAYGYMVIDKTIVSDVWLYNSANTPVTPPWRDGPEGLPFCNPTDFAGVDRFEPVKDDEDISFLWVYGPDKVPIAVEFWIRGKRHGRVTTDSKPGWCVLATKDGPLARKLT
jgi:hypothetical protein